MGGEEGKQQEVMRTVQSLLYAGPCFTPDHTWETCLKEPEGGKEGEESVLPPPTAQSTSLRMNSLHAPGVGSLAPLLAMREPDPLPWVGQPVERQCWAAQCGTAAARSLVGRGADRLCRGTCDAYNATSFLCMIHLGLRASVSPTVKWG